jgi:hypothetical protein
MAVSVIAIIVGWAIWGQGDSASDQAKMDIGVNILLQWFYVILGLAVVCMIVFSIVSLLQNPKSAVQSLLGLAAVVVVVGISWALSSGETVVTPTKTYTDVSMLKLADTSLFAMYVLLAGAILAVIFGELRGFFK